MRTRILVTVITGVCLTTYANAADRIFQFSPTENQRLEYVEGQQLLLVEGATASMVVSFSPEAKKSGWISLGVRNTSPESFVVQESSIRATSGEKPLEVFTYAKLMKQQGRREAWRQVGAALGAAGNSMSAANAGYRNSYGTYSSTTTASAYGSGGYAHGTANTTGSYSSTTYDHAAAAAAQDRANEKNRELVAQVHAANSLERNSLEARALRANTLSPGESIWGQVKIELPRSSSITLEITLGGETHKISMTEIED